MNIEEKIEEVLSELTLEEKVGFCHSASKFTVAGVPRLGIDDISMSDGPHGVREEIAHDSWESAGWDNDFCTYLPPETGLAATFEPELAGEFGKVLGEEARARGKDIILGPGINIIRHPLCGRNFEYMSEDPTLISRMVVPLIRGIQSADTSACVKHFALNNQELDRHGVNTVVSRRALYEIYLKGFRAAVKEGGAYTVMAAYNRYLGQHCCHNSYLLMEVLKGKWDFGGAVISDWAGTYDTDEAIRNGLDIEMGTYADYKDFYLADPFLERAKKSPAVRAALDDKVRRILRTALRIKKGSAERKPGAFNTPEHQKVTYDIASEAMVLLKNDGVLPLKRPGKLLVVGDNATVKHAHGGQSSGIKALYEITPLEGLHDRLPDCEIEYIRTTRYDFSPLPVQSLEIADMHAGCRAFKTEVFEQDGSVTVTYEDGVRGIWGKHARYTAAFISPVDGDVVFRLTGKGSVTINGEKVIDCDEIGKYETKLAEGDRLEILIEGHYLSFGWCVVREVPTLEELARKAAEADAVIYCGGLNHSYDSEGFDRRDMKLPEEQNKEIPALIAANPNTVVALTAGCPVEMPWADKAGAIIYTWYAGMEGGHVLADIILGKVNPSGKMPFTLPKRYEDHPAVRYGEYQAGQCEYKEDLLVGYRGFDRDGIEPLFPFGHGLSYTTFEYERLEVNVTDEGVEVSVTVRNTGDRAGREAVQVYVGPLDAIEGRPLRELKAFDKITLEPGQSRTSVMLIPRSELLIYNEPDDTWVMPCENFKAYAGTSSRNLPLEAEFTIE